jgi:hypothetical protein
VSPPAGVRWTVSVTRSSGALGQADRGLDRRRLHHDRLRRDPEYGRRLVKNSAIEMQKNSGMADRDINEAMLRGAVYTATWPHTGIAGTFFFRLIGMPPSEAPRSTGTPFPGGRWPMVVDENEGVTHGFLIHPEVTVQIDAMSVERADLAVLLASIDVAATPGEA